MNEHRSVVFSVLQLLLLLVLEGEADWLPWGKWGRCSVTCGKGFRRRHRECQNTRSIGKYCEGSPLETESCVNAFECPVDGGWSDWHVWSICSVTCGQGQRIRSRKCNQPTPKFGGAECPGDAVETEACKNIERCPRDGGWSPWSVWSPCSVSCGSGTQHRSRKCDNPPPAAEGLPCSGKNESIRSCATNVSCPVNGHWSEWSDWSGCSVTCGTGTRRRTRTCDNPPAQFGGAPCDASVSGHLELEQCFDIIEHCPVHGSWSEWSEWGPCEAASCGEGSNDVLSHSLRHRSCNNPLPAYGGSMCVGVFLDSSICVLPTNCKVDGGWSEWSDWDCKQSLVKRFRTCDNPPPTNGGSYCEDEDHQFIHNTEKAYRELCGGDDPDQDEDEEENDEEEENEYENEEE